METRCCCCCVCCPGLSFPLSPTLSLSHSLSHSVPLNNKWCDSSHGATHCSTARTLGAVRWPFLFENRCYKLALQWPPSSFCRGGLQTNALRSDIPRLVTSRQLLNVDPRLVSVNTGNTLGTLGSNCKQTNVLFPALLIQASIWVTLGDCFFFRENKIVAGIHILDNWMEVTDCNWPNFLRLKQEQWNEAPGSSC